MKFFVRSTAFFTLAVLVATALIAEDEPAAKKGKKAKKTPPTPAAFKLPKGVELSPEQATKFDELKVQYATKLADAQKKVADVFTDEQRASRQAAMKQASAAGKKHKDLKAAVDAAVLLTDEQKQKLAVAQTELKKLTKEIRKGIVGLLTEEQRQAIKGKGKKQA